MTHPAILSLLQVITPPLSGGDVVDWNALTRAGEPELPTDYKDFVATYGGGEIDEYFSVSTPPVFGSPYGDLLNGVSSAVSVEDHDELAGQLTASSVPQLMPFGATASGDVTFWLRDGQPDDWQVAVFRRQVSYGASRWVVFDGGMVEFCLAVVTGVLDPFSERFVADEPHTFTGWMGH